jgi:hypothetical protein
MIDPADQVYPRLAGSAEPGATLDVVDQAAEGEPVVARVIADAAGSFATSDFSSLGFGRHLLAVRQVTVAGLVSPLTAGTPVVLDTITIESPVPGQTIDSLDYAVTASGDPEGHIDMLVGSVVAAAAVQLNADGNAVVQVALPVGTTPGEVTFSVHYIDPSTGQIGPTSSVSVTFDPNA